MSTVRTVVILLSLCLVLAFGSRVWGSHPNTPPAAAVEKAQRSLKSCTYEAAPDQQVACPAQWRENSNKTSVVVFYTGETCLKNVRFTDTLPTTYNAMNGQSEYVPAQLGGGPYPIPLVCAESVFLFYP